MLILLLLFQLSLISCITNIQLSSTSSLLWNGELYVSECGDFGKSSCIITVYTLDSANVKNLKKQTYIGYTGAYLTNYKFLPKSDWIVKDSGGNSMVMLTSSKEPGMKPMDSGGYRIDVEFNFNTHEFLDTGYLLAPNFQNFPQGGYTYIVVNLDNNPTIYFIGGLDYSKNTSDTVLTNYFCKYNMQSKTWTDLTNLTKSILPPIASHETIQYKDSLITISGISSNITSSDGKTSPSNNPVYNTINQIYQFDLIGQKWSKITTKTNLDVSLYGNGQFFGASLDVYNDKLIAYGCLLNLKTGALDPKLGILDPSRWEWQWFNVTSDPGANSENTQLQLHESLVLGDQLVLINGKYGSQLVQSLLVIDLVNKKFTPTLNFVASKSSSSGSSLPVYAIVLIVLACIPIVVMVGYLYWRYKKRSQSIKEMTQNMDPVWSSSTENRTDYYVTKSGNIQPLNNTNLAGGSNNGTTAVETGSTLTDEHLSSLPYFQHEVDMEGISKLEDTNLTQK